MKNYGLLILRNILAGTNSTLQKYLVIDGLIYSVLLVRQSLINVVMLLFVDFSLVKKDIKVLNKKEHLTLLVISLFNSIGICLAYLAILHLPINMFSILEQSMFILLSLGMGYVFLGEKINLKIFIGLCISLIGLALIVTKGTFTSIEGVSILGLGILLAYGIVSGFSGVLSTKLLKKLSSSTYTFLSNFYRLVFYIPIPFFFGENVLNLFKEFENYQWVIILFSCLALFFIDLFGGIVIQKLGYTVRQLFIPLIPCVSSFLAMFLFGEWFNLLQYLGMCLVFSGLFLIIKFRVK